MVFPGFRGFMRLNGLNKSKEPVRFFDCKFYPYIPPGLDPVCAFIGKAEAVVCRPCSSDASAFEILAWFQDQDPNASLNSLEWSYDRLTGAALLCLAGQNAAINVFNVTTKQIVQTLVGHGKDINDLAISPKSPWILASASLDCTVRIWSLDPGHAEQPCMLICAGEGHREGLLCLGFHSTGRYLLSGGMDNVINLWMIPDLPNQDTGTRTPTLLHYPHFSTSSIHPNVVDCLIFHGDLIISKCAEESVIKIWKIENFSSHDPPPTRAPTTHEVRPTRSAWGGGYQILFELETPNTAPFWMRFGFFQGIGHRPILAIGNTESKILFWDFAAIDEYTEDSDDGARTTPAFTTANRQGSVLSNGPESEAMIAAKARKKYSTKDPFRPLLAHAISTIPRINFASRQIAWSSDGKWMVVAGDQGMVAVYHQESHHA